MVTNERYVLIIWLSVLAAITLLTGSTLAQIPEMSDADWMTYNRTLQGDRYSPLKEITTANVKNLKPVATFDTGERVNFETGPIVVDGTMYFTTYQTTYAVGAVTGQLKWRRRSGYLSPVPINRALTLTTPWSRSTLLHQRGRALPDFL